MGQYSRLTRAGRKAWAELIAEGYEVDEITEGWRRACEGAGVSHRIDTVSGPTIVTPTVVHVTLGPPVVLMVQLLPGQLGADLAAAGGRIAPALGGRRLQVTPRGHTHVRVEVIDHDPLAAIIPLVRSGAGTHIGRDESGAELADDWQAMPHAVVQGVTRSGKSGWLYAQLAQLAARPHTIVAGSDPSGLLWRPWHAHRQPMWRVGGLADLGAHVALLEYLVADMDRRIGRIAPDRDTVELGAECPLIVVVLEEYPGLLRAADALDAKLGKRIRGMVSRLLAESHKAGFRLIVVTQRAEANIIGGFERAMCSFRLSFRVDAADSLRLLHPAAAVDRVDEHMAAAPGVALLTAPGRDLARMRAPWLGGYAEYAAAVTSA